MKTTKLDHKKILFKKGRKNMNRNEFFKQLSTSASKAIFKKIEKIADESPEDEKKLIELLEKSDFYDIKILEAHEGPPLSITHLVSGKVKVPRDPKEHPDDHIHSTFIIGITQGEKIELIFSSATPFGIQFFPDPEVIPFYRF